jgi:hypothetical protein
MGVRTLVAGAVVTLAAVLLLGWGIWLAGRLAFDGGGETPPPSGTGVPTTVMTTG